MVNRQTRGSKNKCFTLKEGGVSETWCGWGSFMEGTRLHFSWQSRRAGEVTKEDEEAGGGGWDRRTPRAESVMKQSAAEVLGWDLQGKRSWLAAEETLDLGVVEDGAEGWSRVKLWRTLKARMKNVT